MSMPIIATVLTIVCFGVAFICWCWLSIEETRRHRRRHERLSGPEKLISARALPGGRK